MSPELLAMEAERLGISPENDQDVLTAINKEMEQQQMQSRRE